MEDDVVSVDEGLDKEDIETDTESVLDTSWIAEQQRVLHADQGISKESMESISAYFIYVNKENHIDQISKEHIHLVARDNGSVLSKESVLRIIQSKKIILASQSHDIRKYHFKDILLFHIPFDHDYVQSFVSLDTLDEREHANTFLQSQSVMHADIFLPPSLFVFHKMNSLIFLYQEKSTCNGKKTRQTRRVYPQTCGESTHQERDNQDGKNCSKISLELRNEILPSILRKTLDGGSPHKNSTKKKQVRIVEPLRHTTKHLISN